MPTEMKIICPNCKYDHAEELDDSLDEWVSEDGPYETECLRCSHGFIVHTHVTYAFSTSELERNDV